MRNVKICQPHSVHTFGIYTLHTYAVQYTHRVWQRQNVRTYRIFSVFLF